ncbi:hypothetical protein Taro_052962 [Colocasia esculenta]|uniref:Uncharacterized protein n=1 Tax=Colocasia esculenta TaxID=4460 RepID=A0A843XK00_COLES|nr:hypothetical protein [Colocasia esculenta]
MSLSYEAAPASLSSHPTLGFPLGTTLLLLVIFCLSGVLSCYYHWDNIHDRSATSSTGAWRGQAGMVSTLQLAYRLHLPSPS